eukprot:7376467-Prymnesium_polylepis.3
MNVTVTKHECAVTDETAAQASMLVGKQSCDPTRHATSHANNQSSTSTWTEREHKSILKVRVGGTKIVKRLRPLRASEPC